jgi:ribosomal protein S18 acetylase RimI-like enzyme
MSLKSYWCSDDCFVGYVGTDAACSVFLFPISADTVYVAWVATAEKFRRKGFAEALLRRGIANLNPQFTKSFEQNLCFCVCVWLGLKRF